MLACRATTQGTNLQQILAVLVMHVLVPAATLSYQVSSVVCGRQQALSTARSLRLCRLASCRPSAVQCQGRTQNPRAYSVGSSSSRSSSQPQSHRILRVQKQGVCVSVCSLTSVCSKPHVSLCQAAQRDLTNTCVAFTWHICRPNCACTHSSCTCAQPVTTCL